MFKRYKHDVAISVAEEDMLIARQVAASLQSKKIRYYLYDEQSAENWGQHILQISLDKYGADAKYVLLIISKTFAKKYWGVFESQVAQVFKPGKEPYLLPLRLDNTPIDGISRHIVFVKWENNPDEIAQKIVVKLKIRERKKQKWRIKVSLFASIPVATTVLYFWLGIPPFGKDPIVGPMNPRPDSSIIHDSVARLYKPGKKASEDKNGESYDEKGLTIEGSITDAKTNELLDSVQVNVNGKQTIAKNGMFNVVLPRRSDQRPGYSLIIEYRFNKPGYEAVYNTEAVVLNGNLRIHKTHINLSKVK